MPRLTIGVPVFNMERFLGEAVRSLLAQDFDDFELVISDNGSTDRTPEIARELEAADPRVRFVRHERNRGAAWNFNYVIHTTESELFKWAAADDLYAPTFLARCVEVLDRDPGVVLAYAQTVDVDLDGNVFREWGPLPFATQEDPADRFAQIVVDIRKGFPVFGVMRRAALESTRLHGDYPGCDLVLLAELALLGRFQEVPEPLFLHREHPGRSMNAYKRERGRAEWFDADKAGAITMPRWRRAAEYVRAVQRSSLSAAQRRTAYAAVARWANANRRWLVWNLGGAARDYGLRMIGREDRIPGAPERQPDPVA
ncbi:MAG TPA: glycosyltransferase family 2 protein [Acidimicrobiia bacterium]|nr:glycosyltransferase family 2 protein [Acidimicrobiia bacterium]